MKVNSNWSKLKKKVEIEAQNKPLKPNSKRLKINLNEPIPETVSDKSHEHSYNIPDCIKSLKYLPESVTSKYVGLDCEMVGIGDKGKQSALARCCLVDFHGTKIYDEFVRPPAYVTDFRTKWSGVRREDLRTGTAVTLNEVKYVTLIFITDSNVNYIFHIQILLSILVFGICCKAPQR